MPTKKKFETIDYSNESYVAELDRIRKRFIPLIKICKEYGTAMRIGTNHGSLSDRIMSRYGDNASGMVESALEFVRICQDEGYYNIILSMKSSNPQVMVQAYRLLVVKMKEAGMNYPLHLGVTEAGEGEDGRIKSALGIGTLLEDGLGDTIRVSLTEEPELEIPVAKALIQRSTMATSSLVESGSVDEVLPYNPFEYSRRQTIEVKNFGGHHVPRVIADLSDNNKITRESLIPFGYRYSEKLDKWNIADQACDYLFAGNKDINFNIPGTLGLIYNSGKWQTLENKIRSYPLFSVEELQKTNSKSAELNFVNVANFGEVKTLANDATIVFVFEDAKDRSMAEQRILFIDSIKNGIKNPVIIKRIYDNLSDESLMLHASTDIGGLFIDGLGDGVWIKADNKSNVINSLSFGILQAARTRISKTEYISCPSCGRTLFDLQETTAKIRLRTDHLKGIKIGIMGCIVNGPGEMADADYGYVGSGPGKITLYKGKEVVKRNVPAAEAVEELITVIKNNGDWVERE